MYDTIPTLSETLADSEVNGASKFLGFKSSSSTFKAANAYVDAPHNSPSQRNPLDNASFNSRGNVAKNCITSPSLECVQNVVADAENGEESYTLMLPSGAVANSK